MEFVVVVQPHMKDRVYGVLAMDPPSTMVPVGGGGEDCGGESLDSSSDAQCLRSGIGGHQVSSRFYGKDSMIWERKGSEAAPTARNRSFSSWCYPLVI